MALSVDKLLMDAHTLVIHLRDHDSLANSINAATQALYNKVEAMKQYQDDITELNEIAKHRPRSTLVLGIAQENRQIRELQQENRELQVALEEHQSALELIMQKYREHTVKLLQSNRLEKAIQEREAIDKDSMCHLMDKIDEMAGVMQKAIEVDESTGCVEKERLSRLELENKALREMLEICTTSRDRIVSLETKKDPKDDDDNTDTECDSTVLACPDKKGSEQTETEDKPDTKSDSKESVNSSSKDSTPVASKESVNSPSKDSTPVASKESVNSPGKDSTPVASKDSSPVLAGGKSVGASKSTSDTRKGKPSLISKSDSSVTVKKSMSATSPGVKKDFPVLKKSPSTEVKKDLKAKVTPKAVGKK